MAVKLDQVIAIDLIADEILKNLSTKDLLNLARLNKQWNHIARDYLYRREKTTLQLVLVENRDSNLERLHWLQTSNQKIFKQLSLSIFSCYSQHECDQDFWPLLAQLKEAPLLAPGIVLLEVSDNCLHTGKCEATEFLKSVIRNLPENSIQHLNAKFVKDFNSLFVEKEQFIFPVALQSVNLSSENLEKLYLMPSLREFSGEIKSLELESVLNQGMAHVIKFLNLDYLPNSGGSEMETLLRFAESKPRLQGLTISDTKIRDLTSNTKALTQFFKLILDNSFLSLEKLFCKIDLQVLRTIWEVSGKSFPKVRNFTFPQQQLFEVEILGSIPLSKLFPNLTTVVVSHVKHFKIDRNVLEDNFELNGNEICSSVNTLVFSQFKYQYRFRSEYNKALAKIFPNVKYVSYEFVRDEQELVSFCSSLWLGIWKGLEKVTISVIPSQLYACEWCFLGISKTEWKYWLDLKKAGANLTQLQFPASDESLTNFPGIDFLVQIFSKANPLPSSPSGLLSLTEIQPHLFRLRTCIGSKAQPATIQTTTTAPVETGQLLSATTTRLIHGIQNQISRLLRIG